MEQKEFNEMYFTEWLENMNVTGHAVVAAITQHPDTGKIKLLSIHLDNPNQELSRLFCEILLGLQSGALSTTHLINTNEKKQDDFIMPH